VAFWEVGNLTNQIAGFDPNGPHVQPQFGTSAYAFNVTAHAAVGCASALASGGKCGPSALAGGVSSAAGPATNGNGFFFGLVANTTLGGGAAVLGGGKFENGAITSAFGYLFNAAAGTFAGRIAGGAAAGALGWETGPLEPAVIMAGRWLGGLIGSAIEDWLISPAVAPPPNDGNGPAHGGEEHDEAIDEQADKARDQGATNIRKNQVQVDINGDRVGDNRPDLQYDLNGQHYNWEWDNNGNRSADHGMTIIRNDPNSICYLKMLKC
jgi:hypothetical protein